jgi:hypothetical protein
LADRKIWFENMLAKAEAPPPKRPVPTEAPARPIVEEFNGNASRYGGGFPQVPRPTVQPVAPQQPNPRPVSNPPGWLDSEDRRILRVASEHGYQIRTSDNRILYNGTEWLELKTWWQKMRNLFE